VVPLPSPIKDYPDAAPILCQVVGAESGAWNMFLEGAHGADCSFKWTPQPVILQAKHPMVKHLPMEEPNAT
jgi:hypothetical protein